MGAGTASFKAGGKAPARSPAGTPSRRMGSDGGTDAQLSPALPVLPAAVGLYTGLAGFGSAALCSALASSLLVRAGTLNGFGAVLAWTGGLAGILWALAVLVFSVSSLRAGWPVWARQAAVAFGIAAAVHLAVVLAGLWAGPATGRTFDLNAACAVVLELSIIAAIGWLGRQGTRASRTLTMGRAGGTTHSNEQPAAAPPAGQLLLALFAASLLVAGVTTPGLAASTAGSVAVPHSGHHSGTESTIPGTPPIPDHHH